MTNAKEERKEVRAQRHDFIKEYYKMATLDLDRHLKAGWQTIAVLAGGAALLAAGHEGKIGLPIAASIALVSAFWGALFVIDANYWSLRAIGFLANVEAIYFSVEDRRVFNPYAGNHPPYHLMNSLKYMFGLCVLFGIFVLLNLVWEIVGSHPTMPLFCDFWRSLSPVQRFLWSLPLLVTLWGGLWTYHVWRKSVRGYIAFSEGSPGPGLRLTIGEMRHVTLEGLDGQPAPAIEPQPQVVMLAELRDRSARLERFAWVLLLLVAGATILVMVFVGR